jgi:hypothetical protein
VKTISIAVCLALSAPLAKAAPVLHGEGSDQLTIEDVYDLEALAAEIVPRHRIAVIDCVIRKEGEHAGQVSLLHVFSEPDEQTYRLWRGLYFKCTPEFAYNPPRLPQTASDQDRYLNLTFHQRGRWIAQFADPVRHYAVISLPGTMLPGFSTNFLDHYPPFEFGSKTDSKEAIAAYDFIIASGAPFLADQSGVDLKSEPVHFLQVSSQRATVHLGRFKFELRRLNSQWQIAKVKTYPAAFGGITRSAR